MSIGSTGKFKIFTKISVDFMIYTVVSIVNDLF